MLCAELLVFFVQNSAPSREPGTLSPCCPGTILCGCFQPWISKQLTQPTTTVNVSRHGAGAEATTGKERVKNYLAKFHVSKSAGPDEIRPRVRKEPAEEISQPLAILGENSWSKDGREPRGLEKGKYFTWL